MACSLSGKNPVGLENPDFLEKKRQKPTEAIGGGGVRGQISSKLGGRATFSTSFVQGDSRVGDKAILICYQIPKGDYSSPVVREIWGGDYLLMQVHV